MKKIVFFITDPKCTASFACGVTLKHALDSLNILTEINNDITQIKDSIVVLFKHALSKQHIEILKKNNNKIVIDVVDEFIRPGTDVVDLYDYSDFDGAISRIKKVNTDYAFSPHLNLTYIPHHWDIRLQEYSANHSNINYKPVCISNDLRDMPYLNELHSQSLIDFLINIGFETYEQSIKLFLKYNIHYNIRTTNSLAYKFKPATKLVTAAALNTPLITNYDWALQDLIPNDYPFLIIDPSFNTISNFIQAIPDMSKSDFNYSLEILEEVKYKTALINLLPTYIEFFNKF